MTYNHLLMQLIFHINNMICKCNDILEYIILMNIVIYKVKIRIINLSQLRDFSY